MRARVLLDTGPLVAMLSRRDAQHERCVGTMREVAAPLLTCWPVITEAAWLLRHQPAAVWRMLEGFHAGWLTPLQLDEHAGEALARIMRRYQKLGAQLADAALLYLADREQLETIFTLDRRDFSVYRLPGNRRLFLLPE